MPAPIAIFAFRRPEHLARVLDALRRNPEAHQSPLYVFADAARHEKDAGQVAEVRRLLSRVEGFREVHVVLREQNYGLARNITSGVSEVLSRHSEIIVVEDDVLVGQFFLRFMNDALSHYRDELRVGSVTGYCYPVKTSLPETFFIRGADCWGWATWCDRWQVFNPNGGELLEQLRARELTHAFDFDGTMPFTQMLQDQIAGRNDSWAVRWHASCFLREMLILYPGCSLVHNIGQDGSGTHGRGDSSYDVSLEDSAVTVGAIALEENRQARAAFGEFFRRSQQSPPFLKRAVGAMWRRFKAIVGAASPS
jgi:GR25 family glycosyltransferase involved in LPS biosynthesis